MHTEAIRLVGRSQAAWFLERGEHCCLLASLCRRQGLFDEAEELLQQAILDAHEDDSQLQWVALEKALLAVDLGQPGAGSDQLASLIRKCIDDDKLLLKACICLGWLSFCQEDWSRAMENFETAISMSDHFADGGINLEMAISFAGAAASQVQSADARQGRKLLYEEKAAQYLHCFPFQQANGVQIVKYCLGICMELRDHKQAHQLFADALVVQCKVFADGHSRNALFLQKVQVKARELSRTTVSVVANTTGMSC